MPLCSGVWCLSGAYQHFPPQRARCPRHLRIALEPFGECSPSPASAPAGWHLFFVASSANGAPCENRTRIAYRVALPIEPMEHIYRQKIQKLPMCILSKKAGGRGPFSSPADLESHYRQRAPVANQKSRHGARQSRECVGERCAGVYSRPFQRAGRFRLGLAEGIEPTT